MLQVGTVPSDKIGLIALGATPNKREEEIKDKMPLSRLSYLMD